MRIVAGTTGGGPGGKFSKGEAHSLESGDTTDLIIPDSLDHDQTPCYHQGLYRVGEGMGLVSPSNVGRGNQDNGQGPMPWRFDQLMNSPVLEHDTENHHEDP